MCSLSSAIVFLSIDDETSGVHENSISNDTVGPGVHPHGTNIPWLQTLVSEVCRMLRME